MMLLENIFSSFLIVLTALYCSLMIFYMMKWRREKEFIDEKKKPFTNVSIIIPARNEEQNICSCLQSILQQDYPKELVEVILADDASEDKTLQVANEFKIANKFSNLMIIPLKETNSLSPKKRAITEGIKNALGDLIITTDADCTMSQDWLSTIVSFHETKSPKMIASPVCIKNEKTVFDKIQSLEISGLMLLTGAAIFSAKPLMCNGANLAFTKNIFEEVAGYDEMDNLASGDDVMLMRKIQKNYPDGIHFLKSSNAIVFTSAQKTLRSFFNQRKRWASKIGAMNDNFVNAISVLIWLLSFSLLLSAFCLIFFGKFVALFIVCFSVKCSIDFLLLFLTASFFEKKKLLLFFLHAEVFQAFYVTISVLLLHGKYNWKNRKLK